MKQGRLLGGHYSVFRDNEGHADVKREEGHRVPTASEKEDMFLREAFHPSILISLHPSILISLIEL